MESLTIILYVGLKRVSGGENPSDPLTKAVVPSLGRVLSPAEEADYRVVHGVAIRVPPRVLPEDHWTSTPSGPDPADPGDPRNVPSSGPRKNWYGGIAAYQGVYWGDAVVETPTPARPVISLHTG